MTKTNKCACGKFRIPQADNTYLDGKKTHGRRACWEWQPSTREPLYREDGSRREWAILFAGSPVGCTAKRAARKVLSGV